MPHPGIHSNAPGSSMKSDSQRQLSRLAPGGSSATLTGMLPPRCHPAPSLGPSAPRLRSHPFLHLLGLVLLAMLSACRQDPPEPAKTSTTNPPIPATSAPSASHHALQEVPGDVTTTPTTNATLQDIVAAPPPVPFPYEKLIEFAMAERGAYFMSGRVFRFSSDRKAIVDLSESFDNAIADLAHRQLRYYERMEAASRLRDRSKRLGPGTGPPRPALPPRGNPEAGLAARSDARLEAAWLSLSTEVLDSRIGEDLEGYLELEARVPLQPEAISVQLKSPLAALGSMVIVNTSDRDLTDCILISTAERDVEAVAQSFDQPTTWIHQWLDEVATDLDPGTPELPMDFVEALRSAVDRRTRFFVQSFPAGATFIAKGLPPMELSSCTAFRVSLYSRELYVRNVVAPDLAAAQAAQSTPRHPAP